MADETAAGDLDPGIVTRLDNAGLVPHPDRLQTSCEEGNILESL